MVRSRLALGFAFAPILALYASNAATFRLGVINVPALLAALITLAVFALAASRLRNLQKAAVVTSYFSPPKGMGLSSEICLSRHLRIPGSRLHQDLPHS